MVTFYRRLPKFDYLSPNTLDEVLDLIAGRKRSEFILYAGGTDVIPKLKRRLIDTPKMLVDLKKISDLDYIVYDQEKGVKIGALASVRTTAISPIVKEHFPILSQAAGSIASPQIQNRATIVGNICMAVPSADSAPALLVLKARVLCVSLRGERIIPIEEFFTGPNQTILMGDEIVKEIQIDNMPKGNKGTYIKLSPRKRMDLAVVGVGVVILHEDDICREIRIALGAVAPTPIRAKRAEEKLSGERLTKERVEQCAQIAAEESKPIDDHRASAYYRKAMIRILVKKAIQETLYS